MPKMTVAALSVALIVASVFAIWPVLADAPWESGSSSGGDELSGDKDGNSPVSTRFQVEDLVRRHFTSECQPLIERIESEFLGDDTWEVAAEFRFSPGPSVAIFRVGDGILSIQPLNWVAQSHVCMVR